MIYLNVIFTLIKFKTIVIFPMKFAVIFYIFNFIFLNVLHDNSIRIKYFFIFIIV